MKVRVYFEFCTRDEAGNIDKTFGLEMTVGEAKKEIDYQKLASLVDKDMVLLATCLDGIVNAEDVKIITPEEYDEKYGEEVED